MTTYLALGDSYTIGEGVAAEERWPVRLARALRSAGVEVSDPTIVATTGWTTAELLDGIDASALQPPYGLVSLLIGVNNQYRAQPLARYRAELARLLDRAEALAGGDASRVFMLSIPDWGRTPFAADDARSPEAIASEVDRYNAVAHLAAARRGIPFVDVTALSRALSPSDVVEDRLHYAAPMYARWTRQALPVVREMLQPQS